VPWLLSVYAGRVNIEEGKACYNAKGKRADGPSTGVQHSAGEFLSSIHSSAVLFLTPNALLIFFTKGVQKGGYIMIITSLSYGLLQIPAVYLKVTM
jgi:hypothetical protein